MLYISLRLSSWSGSRWHAADRQCGEVTGWRGLGHQSTLCCGCIESSLRSGCHSGMQLAGCVRRSRGLAGSDAQGMHHPPLCDGMVQSCVRTIA